MKQRVGALLGRPLRDFGQLDQPWPMVCTFHSLCLRILRHYAPTIGLPSNFSIFDSSDQAKVMKEAIKILELSTTNFPPSQVHATISNAKNQLITAAAFAQTAGDFYQRNVARIYAKYEGLLKQNNALDFDDLLLRTVLSFRSHPTVLDELQERFQYLLIDEYQDTNHAQYILAHAMAQKHRNLCVVGDPDQSIYAWRGADIRNILHFEQDYPDARVVKLEQNYRSTKTILAVASKLIACNKQRKEKTLWTENEQGEKVQVVLCQDEHDEAATVARMLRELHERHQIGWNSMAIFYRINALSRVMEDALRRGGMPYVMARGVEFYNRKEIKDVLSFLRVIANPADEVSLDRIANVPARGISDASLKSMQGYAVSHGIGLWDAMKQADRVPGLSSRAQASTLKFVGMIESLRAMVRPGEVRQLMEEVVRRTGYEDYLRKLGGEELEELANVNELITSAAEYDDENPEGSLDAYLAGVSLMSDTDHLKDNGGAITMMTLHAAKGLEFPVVAMIGLEEGCLPHARARESESELEEERRLCFVGITRAQQRLILTKAAYRTIRGLRERTVTSPFLAELPQEHIEVTDRAKFGGLPSRTSDEAIEDALPNKSEFRRGQMVRHQQFGIGRIAEISAYGSHTRAVVEFKNAGRKTLILQYARLEAVG
jgi:DNA helicase-2/ATP-dependent DNA helicase PcrA